MKRDVWVPARALAFAWLGGAALLTGTTTGCGGGSRSPSAVLTPTLPAGADAAVAARSLALDRAALAGPGGDLSGFYTADYRDDEGFTRTTLLAAIQAFLTRYTIVSQSQRQSVLRDTATHVVETWSDTLAVQDKMANNAAGHLNEGEIDYWRPENGTWRIDQSQAPPAASVQLQRPPVRGRFR